VEKLLMLALAGGAGALSRYGLAGLVQRLAGGAFPLGTFVVNALGCFFFGMIWGALETRLGPQFRVVVLTGFMGSFTTFSTYAFESVTLAQHGQWLLALANVLGQNVLGLSMLVLGLVLGRAL
jgi:fluoride exporter